MAATAASAGPPAGAEAAHDAGPQDLTDRIMEYQRREYELLSQRARREREMLGLRRRAGEAAHAYEDTRKDSLQNACVDPAVNIEIAMLRQRLKEKNAEVDRLKDELHNATFHPNSIQGQKLLSKCAHLLEENAELGRQLGEDRMQSLIIQIVLERRKRVQLRQRIAEFDQHAEQIDAENERMQKKIADLGQCLKGARSEIDRMKKDIEEWNMGAKRKKDKVDKAPEAVSEKPQAPVPVAAPTPQPAAADADGGGNGSSSKRIRRDR
mmetsp:Transcript_88418/g.249142  ORF Transcript_88418/g.249142 Transcript_88418/m.249142 type:complete len:267 (+) Transcript_88418:211-1011(+)